MDAGQCMNLINGFVCSEGEYRNYPCPYANDIRKCKNSIVVAEEMARQWETKGYVAL